MNRSECLTRFILSREYNPDAKSINYNADLWYEERLCPSGFSLSMQGECLLNSICDADSVAWNAMEEYCNKCKFRSDGNVQKVKCSFDEGDSDITGFICHHTKSLTEPARRHRR